MISFIRYRKNENLSKSFMSNMYIRMNARTKIIF